LNCTPDADLSVFPDDDDLPATHVLATDPRRHQLADEPVDLSRDRAVGGKPTRAAGAPQGAEERKRRGSTSRRSALLSAAEIGSPAK
jgi:hypothetical protein